MTETRVQTPELHTMANREQFNGAVIDQWAQPDTALMMSVLATHGPQAALFVEGLAEYYTSRAHFGTIHAGNYRTTAGALDAAAARYDTTDATNAHTLGEGSLQV